MAARTRGPKPTVEKQKMFWSREAAAAHSARPIAVAASRLSTSFCFTICGLTPNGTYFRKTLTFRHEQLGFGMIFAPSI
jgi:hypothetical protein